MRLATLIDGHGVRRAGVVLADGSAVDLAAADPALPGTLLGLVEAGPDALVAARRAAAQADAGARVAPADVRVGVPIARPPKFLATAGNYQAHILEGGLPPVDKARIVPKLFLKPATTLLDPEAAIPLPTVSTAVDYELELGVVIGRRCRDVPVERALDVVAGYTNVNDVSARVMDWGVADRAPSYWDEYFDWLQGKWPDGFGPCGPWLVTPDEIPDPQQLGMDLRVNGERRQHGSTAEMLFSVAEVIAFATRFMTLEPGDLIATGTPAGVGDTTKRYLESGDVIEGRIDGLGILRSRIGGPPG